MRLGPLGRQVKVHPPAKSSIAEDKAGRWAKRGGLGRSSAGESREPLDVLQLTPSATPSVGLLVGDDVVVGNVVGGLVGGEAPMGGEGGKGGKGKKGGFRRGVKGRRAGHNAGVVGTSGLDEVPIARDLTSHVDTAPRQAPRTTCFGSNQTGWCDQRVRGPSPRPCTHTGHEGQGWAGVPCVPCGVGQGSRDVLRLFYGCSCRLHQSGDKVGAGHRLASQLSRTSDHEFGRNPVI